MRYLILSVALLMAAQGWASEAVSQVCLKVDAPGQEPSGRPKMVCNVDDFSDFYYVKPGELACFDVSKTYYLMSFLSENSAQEIYGTDCRYVPSLKDAHRTIVFKGENGDSICPVY